MEVSRTETNMYPQATIFYRADWGQVQVLSSLPLGRHLHDGGDAEGHHDLCHHVPGPIRVCPQGLLLCGVGLGVCVKKVNIQLTLWNIK